MKLGAGDQCDDVRCQHRVNPVASGQKAVAQSRALWGVGREWGLHMPAVFTVAFALIISLVRPELSSIPQPSVVPALLLSPFAVQMSVIHVVHGSDCSYSTTLQSAATNGADDQITGVGPPGLFRPSQQQITSLASQSAITTPVAAAQGDITASIAPAAERVVVTTQDRAAMKVADSMTPRETAMFAALNDQRAVGGLTALQFDQALLPIARARSSDMANRNYFSHTTPEGGTVQDLVSAAGLRYTCVNEILARTNYPDSECIGVVVKAFMNSPAHRAHVLHSAYSGAAIGEACSSSGTKYFTVVLASGGEGTRHDARPCNEGATR